MRQVQAGAVSAALGAVLDVVDDQAAGVDDLDDGGQELGRLGIATVAVALDGRKLLGPPVIATRGIPNVDGDAAALRSLALEAARAVEQFREGRGLELGEHVRRTVRRKIEDLSGTRPVVEVSLVHAD